MCPFESHLSLASYCIRNVQIPSTFLRNASEIGGTLPRAKNCSPAPNFCTGVYTGAALSSPISRELPKNPDTHLGIRIFWCERWDSNPHGGCHTHLKRACLPFQHSRKRASILYRGFPGLSMGIYGDYFCIT